MAEYIGLNQKNKLSEESIKLIEKKIDYFLLDKNMDLILSQAWIIGSLVSQDTIIGLICLAFSILWFSTYYKKYKGIENLRNLLKENG